LIRSLARVTRDTDSAEECLQAAFVRLEEYRQTKSVVSEVRFLARAARNIAIDELRKSRVRASTADHVRASLQAYQDNQPLQDEVLVTRERLTRARDVLESLPERTRTIFLMHRFTRVKYREIASEIGISVSAVEKHIAKAALALAESIEQEEGTWEC
jgi:RNA polymerase sigma-70 factor (ECF subfamily)